MTHAAKANGRPRNVQWEAAGAAPDPGIAVPVFANFRQYLMGWDAARRPVSDLDVFRSGILTPQFNGVVRVRSAARVGQAVTAAREALTGLPWWWWVGPDSPEPTADALRRHGGEQVAVLPVMVRPLDPSVEPTPAGWNSAPGLRVETVRDAERLARLVGTYRASMGVSLGLEAEMARLETQREDNADITRLAAVLDDRVVGSTVVITAHGVAGIFLVHVAEGHRRQGIGTALTATALAIGRQSEMHYAALVASPAGEPLYQRFDFAKKFEYRLFTFPP